ncbi:MAG: HDOD domain-containing protein [candidate division Zixibacteria bacterium]|nr:HDOD domain-containing protein [candidate division Zixibacteria bacterium]MBU1469790.1 HDOD domain-containing protein [candidate division Zixibacteria bacterium]MBU2625385.1 HDOD domain-containing protein [candidate division Zixibacteria bacterium]
MQAKIRILFVDDQKDVLDGLRRMLHGLRTEWEMEFVESAAEALTALGEKHFDVIVTDMMMPGMNGAELLEKARELCPGTVRYILSGCSDRELVMQSVGVAHRYIAKPCDPEDLKAMLASSLGLRELLASETLHSRIATIRSLPSPPNIYFQLVRELQSDKSSVKHIAEIISKDVSLTAKMLQLINSAFFGLPTRIESPLQAVNLLGLDTVRDLAMITGAFSKLTSASLSGISVESIYAHSLAVGMAAKKLARELTLPKPISDDAMVAGMLHDIGKLVLLAHFRDEMSEAIKITRERGMSQHLAEAEVLGVSHAEIGAHLLSLWGLPDSILEAVAHHHRPSEVIGLNRNLLTVVHIANGLEYESHFDDFGHSLSKLDTVYLDRLGLTKELPELCDAVGTATS